MTYLKLTITITGHYQENLIAELLELDFEGFEQFEERIEAFIPKHRFDDSSREYIEQLLMAYPGENYVESEEIEDQNWNSHWEKSLKPQQIGEFLVKPTWSDLKPSKGQILIEIDPKMSFGTGYHATTRLMLLQLSQTNVKGKKVLDAGTGTGILAIAAARKGASAVLAFDIDPWSEQNAKENVRINKVQARVDVMPGGFEIIPKDEQYDLILANINRNVLMAHLSLMKDHLASGGDILITGILHTDFEQLTAKAASIKLKTAGRHILEEWGLLHFTTGQ